MKKTYAAPSVQIVSIKKNVLLSLSADVETSTNTQYSKKGGFSFDDDDDL